MKDNISVPTVWSSHFMKGWDTMVYSEYTTITVTMETLCIVSTHILFVLIMIVCIGSPDDFNDR